MMKVICPKCKLATTPWTFEADLVFDRCEQCKGMWLDSGELARVSGSLEDFPSEAKRSGPQTLASCPKCLTVRLQEIKFSPKDQMIVEICVDCKGLWLDSRELIKAREILQKDRIEFKKRKLKAKTSL
jgi:Zn-finger nucleic acid-binding protein